VIDNGLEGYRKWSIRGKLGKGNIAVSKPTTLWSESMCQLSMSENPIASIGSTWKPTN